MSILTSPFGENFSYQPPLMGRKNSTNLPFWGKFFIPTSPYGEKKQHQPPPTGKINSTNLPLRGK